MKFVSLRAEIRSITDAAAKPLLISEIYARITRRGVRMDYFYVAVNQMCDAGQLTKHAVTGFARSRYTYSSGAEPVDATKEYRPERSRLKGFRELAREARGGARREPQYLYRGR